VVVTSCMSYYWDERDGANEGEHWSICQKSLCANKTQICSCLSEQKIQYKVQKSGFYIFVSGIRHILNSCYMNVIIAKVKITDIKINWDLKSILN